jgi:hypothetical protein
MIIKICINKPTQGMVLLKILAILFDHLERESTRGTGSNVIISCGITPFKSLLVDQINPVCPKCNFQIPEAISEKCIRGFVTLGKARDIKS